MFKSPHPDVKKRKIRKEVRDFRKKINEKLPVEKCPQCRGRVQSTIMIPARACKGCGGRGR